jgi:hypothetical protein
MRTGDSPRGTSCATLSSASGKEGWENVYFLTPPLSVEGEERVDQRSVVGVSNGEATSVPAPANILSPSSPSLFCILAGLYLIVLCLIDLYFNKNLLHKI